MLEMHEFEKVALIVSLKETIKRLEVNLQSLENSSVLLDGYDVPNNVSTAFKMVQFSIMQIKAANAQMIQSSKAAIDALEKM